MKNILVNLRSPTIIGAILVLPFMILELINRRSFHSRFVHFQGRFRDSVSQLYRVFALLSCGRSRDAQKTMSIDRHCMPCDRKSRNLPCSSAPVRRVQTQSWFLCAATSCLHTRCGVLRAAIYCHQRSILENRSQNERTVSFHEDIPILLFGSLWLLPVAFILILMPIVRTVRVGNRIMVNPISLLLRVAFLILIAWLWVGTILDQMPCFLGVPNCD